MIITDRIYGKFKIDDPVILRIIKSPSFKRLKKISQFGVSDEFYHIKNFYRDEHCIGVMILLKSLGASREEQVAGLLHDISHTAFSHVIDWVIGNSKKESFQDEVHKSFLEKTEIPKILIKYGMDSSKISDYKQFKLLERKIPNLCADRIDYSLRELPKNLAKQCFKAMVVKDNLIVFKEEKSAYLFASNFLNLQKNHWGGFEALSRYYIFGGILKYALDIKIIEMDDFWKDEKLIISKLKSSSNQKIKRTLKILTKKSLKHLTKSKTRALKKFRHVDPYFIKNEKLFKLSEKNKEFAKELEIARIDNEKGMLIPAI